MPDTPCWIFRSSPDPEETPLPDVVIVRQPVMSLTWPNGCTENPALMLDTMPVMDREPQVVPDKPGGGHSYDGLIYTGPGDPGTDVGAIEYRNMGIAPTGSASLMRRWSGDGATQWTVWVDGAPTLTTINALDGTPGLIGVQFDNSPTVYDWTVPHTWQLQATYHDRPGYTEYYIDPANIGVVASGMCGLHFDGCVSCGGTCCCPPHGCTCTDSSGEPPQTEVIDVLCCQPLNGSPPVCCCGIGFATIGWAHLGYWNPWVSTHHAVGDVNGPVDRYGNYLGLTGPWGANVPRQRFQTIESHDCGGAACRFVYAEALGELDAGVNYAEVTYTVASSVQTLGPCVPVVANPVFDVTKAHKAHH